MDSRNPYAPSQERRTRLAQTSVATFASQVYTWLTAGLGITAVLAFLCYQNGWFISLAPWAMPISLAALGVSLVVSAGINRISYATAAMLFITYSLLQGLMFGIILPLFAIQYGGDIIWVSFATASALFATASLYGRWTQSDLTQVAKLLNFGVLALLVISLVFLVISFFTPLRGMDLIIAYAGLVIFVGLIVTDSQRIRQMSQEVSMQSDSSQKMALLAALGMYINVIMVFWYLLRIFASSRDSR
jgi:FtsH-binding integral membrane protein